MLAALLWDVDGTLAETERDGHRVAFNLAFKEFGVPWRWDAAEYAALLRVTGGRERILHDMAQRDAAPADPAERERLALAMHRRKNVLYGQIVAQGGLRPRPGVQALIDEAHAAGLAQAIVTTTSRANVDALLPTLCGPDWQRIFRVVVAGEDAPRKKPDPQAYELACQRLHLAPAQALAIEDSAMGVRAALGAGVPVLMARSSYFAGDAGDGALAVCDGLAAAGFDGVAALRRLHAGVPAASALP